MRFFNLADSLFQSCIFAFVFFFYNSTFLGHEASFREWDLK
jgi:hypothetical protein